MNRVEQYVDRLFAKYKPTPRNLELKNEILSNLEAKVSDLVAQGRSCEEAVSVAIEGLEHIDHLVEDKVQLYIHRYRLDLLQTGLLYGSILWILIIPLSIFSRIASALTMFLPLVLALLLIFYVVMSRNYSGDQNDTIGFVKVQRSYQLHKVMWWLWGLFVLISVLMTTGIHFASNIWFQRPIVIRGPYHLAEIATQYILPLLMVCIPLLARVNLKLIDRHKAGDQNEW